MELLNVLKACGIDESYLDMLNPGWEKAVDAFDGGIPHFLTKEMIEFSRKQCRMDEELDTVLYRVADRVAGNEELKMLAWHCYFNVFLNDEHKSFQDWPRVNVLGDDFGVFYLLIALGMIPEVVKRYKEKGIPEEVISDTCLEVRCFFNNHIVGYNGLPGLIPKQLAWLRNYYNVRLFRLGRFEYKLEPAKHNYLYFRNRKTGEKLVLSGEGNQYNQQGLIDGSGDVWDDNPWIASIEKSADAVTGYPIAPYGYALNKTISLNLNDWEQLAGEGEWCIDMHIPSGGGMSPDVCLDSMRKAISFFADYFPEQKAKVIICGSWIFNPQFEEYIPKSNLTKFLKELYLYPIHSSGEDGIFFVFCNDYKNLKNPPRDTSLQRMMLDVLENGKQLRSAGMVFFNEDIDKFGTQCYRNMWDQTKL